MEIHALRSLAALTELGSLARVSEALHLTPSAVHKQLKAIESELEARLYDRAGRQIRITPLLDLIIPHVRELLAQHDAIVQAVAEWKGMRKGLIRIGTGPGLASRFLPELLKRFRKAYPALDMWVETGRSEALLEHLRAGQLDVVLLTTSEYLDTANLVIEAKWDFELVLVGGMRQLPKQCSLQELQDRQFILFQERTRTGRLIERYFDRIRFRPRTALRVDTAEAIRPLVESGLGISVLPYWSVEEDVKRGRLQHIRQKEPPLFSDIVLARQRARFVGQPIAAFLKTARSYDCRTLHLKSP